MISPPQTGKSNPDAAGQSVHYVLYGVAWYMVESGIPGPIEGGYGGLWPLFDCTDADLERVPEDKAS